MGKFVIFMGVFPAAVSIFCAGFIKIIPYAHPENVVESGFRKGLISSYPWIVMVADVILFVGISVPSLVHVWRAAMAPVVAVAPPHVAVAVAQTGEDARIGFLRTVRSSRFWFLLISSALATGAYASLLNNIHVFAKSLKMSNLDVKNLISISSGLSFLGSLSLGVLSDWVLKHYGCGRPWFLVVSTLCMIGGHIICRVGNLFIEVAIVGALYGAHLGYRSGRYMEHT
ncbi:hypothetical protein L1987_31406 [Smallanthus sonchifolius]|uniref:Uncharacterized protein n=1 Tax=Smallanthus sonchifolius TaxID=185202 RepID=A0ACB9I5C3_9ASTR|nr:hypothetical protein L1987_31406 [Smallanthus sonchifolius]